MQKLLRYVAIVVGIKSGLVQLNTGTSDMG